MTTGSHIRPTDEELADWMPNTVHTRQGREGHRRTGHQADDFICRCDLCAKLRRDFWEQQGWIP